LTKNFNSPYKAINVGDFWKRWHISLSSWLKDYLYIPLGGNREGSFASYLIIFLSFFVLGIMAESWKVPAFLGISSLLIFLLTKWITKFRKWLNTNINLMLTMLLGGLWHGSSWNFVFWGGLNGLGLVVYKFWKDIRPWNPKSSLLTRFFGIVTTLFFVTFTRAWFRSESWESAISILSRIWTSFDISIVDDILFGFWRPLGLMLIGYLIHWIPERQKSWYRETFINAPLFIQWMISALTILLLYQAMAADSQPFIYFQF
jgi:D-alanyl-lipoteichoic acid acyltransferase DltB (MBOAT superfamily)